MRGEDVPEISITMEDVDKNIAVVSVTPAVLESQVIVNQVQILEDKMKRSDSLEHPKQSTTTFETKNVDTPSKQQISEQDVKKITKSINNGTKRKTKLRRMGSRQNSKTESDSDEEPQNVVLDAPRRVKRKTSKSKRLLETEKSIEEQTQQGDDIVYVLKIKPGQKIEQTEVSFDFKPQNEENILISPTETCIELISGSAENINAANANANVFVKTKRKIFTPVDNQIGTVIGKDIESSSASDKNETESLSCPKSNIMEENETKVITNLPPLPQSPCSQRRLEQKSNPPKEPSPAIRIMIAKYNQRLSAERRNSSPHSSGSCSPVAWRSPVLERRIRTQTEKYLCQVTKSSSAGNVQKEVVKQSDKTDPKIINLSRGVIKSSSTGILTENWKLNTNNNSNPDISIRTSLACDSLKKINSKKEISNKADLSSDERHVGVYRKHYEHSPVSSKSGAFRKILMKPPTKDDYHVNTNLLNSESSHENVPDKSANTVPKIKRKYDAKPPSPRSDQRALKACLELNVRNTLVRVDSNTTTQSDDSPGSLFSDRALKLKRAKEEFLRNSSIRSFGYCQNEDVWKNRLSQISAGSESSTDEIMITKSASVGMIHSSGVDDTHSSDAGGYESLPRNVTRTSKSQSNMGKFGFSTIASKLRKVKLRKNSKELSKMNTVTKLCRQSLMVDITRSENSDGMTRSSQVQPERTLEKSKSQSAEKLRKSGSASAMGFGSLLFRRQERSEKLKKSKSIGQLENEPKGDHYRNNE